MVLGQTQLVSHAMACAPQPWLDQEQRALRVALHLYDGARIRCWWRHLRSILTRRCEQLLDLSEVQETCTVTHRHYAGIQTVSLDRIRGSHGRCGDFDAAFYPKRTHCRNRWLGIALAQEMGVILPPVKLVQIGEVYFVQDGHHRISVARALGKACIEAEVVVWHAVGALPWAPWLPVRQEDSSRRRPVAAPAGSG